MARRDGEYHHILHHRALHESNKDNKKLRQSMGMIALIDYDSHDDLHRACPGVPPLDIYMAQRVNKLYQPHPDPLKGIDRLSSAIETASQHHRAHPIEVQLAGLTLEAVRLQIPFIKGGLIRGEL